jgi:hypothetical protein
MTTTIMTLNISEPDLMAYANGLRASYGSSASHYARRRAMDFKSCGDHNGATVWSHLATLLDTETSAPASR